MRAKTLLDLLFTTNAIFIYTGPLVSATISDCDIIQFSIYGSKRTTDTNSIKYNSIFVNCNFRKAKWKKIETKILKRNFSRHIGRFKVIEVTKILYEELIKIRLKHAPYKLARSCKKPILRDRRMQNKNKQKHI